MTGPTDPNRRRGRPAGSKRTALASWVSGNGQFTMGQLARQMGWPLRDANNALWRARQAGEVRQCGVTRTADAKRPVAVYEPVLSAPAADAGPVALQALMRVWAA